MTHEPTTGLEQYAEAAVYRREYEPEAHADIFRRLGLSEAEVAAAAGHWGTRMVSEMAAGDPSLLLRFAKVYGRLEHQVRLRRPAPSEVRSEFSAASRAMKPSFPERAMAPVTPAGAVAERTASTGASEPMAAEARWQAPLVPSYLRALEQDRGTAAVESPAKREPATAGLARPTVALPELGAGASDAGSAPLPDPDETAMVDPVAAAQGAELPFERRSALERLENLRRAAREAAREGSAKASTSPPEARGTVAITEDLDVGPVLPFEAGSSVRPEDVDLSMFPLARYAELSVALATDDDRARVLRRFVLTEAMWRAIAQAWGARINQEPELRREFDAAIARARAAK